jgi:hypothetical protein
LLALTYSLDARVAIALLAAAFGRSPELAEEGPSLDLQSLNAFEVRAFVRRVLGNSLFLVQHSSDPIKGVASTEMLSLLQDRVFTICVPSARAAADRPLVNFHPKVLLVEFARQNQRWLRVYIGSRNLSLGAAREAAIVLDFAPAERGSARLSGGPILRPLEAFLATTLAQGFLGTNALAATKRHAAAIDEWRRTLQAMTRARRAFIAPKGITSATLFVQWPGSAPLADSLAKDLEHARSSVFVSPWLDSTGATFINRTLPKGARPCLWTLDSELAHLNPLIERRATVVSEAGDSLYERGVEKEGAEIGFQSRLHAKTYAIDVGNGGALWLGSANFTRPGLGLERHPAANFEVLVRLACSGGATRWLGALPTQSLKAALTTGAGTATEKEDEPNPLDWLKATWIDYPKLLRLELRKPASARRFARLYTQLKVVARDARGELQILGTASWLRLWKAGKLELRTRLRDGKLQLDALLQLVPAGHRQAAVFTHAPVPDDVASLRASKYLTARVDLDAALERLAQIQGGLGGGTGRKNGSRRGRNAASYAADIRLERLFLRLLDDDHEDIAGDVVEIISCLKREGSAAGYAELASGLELIVEHAANARARRQ